MPPKSHPRATGAGAGTGPARTPSAAASSSTTAAAAAAAAADPSAPSPTPRPAPARGAAPPRAEIAAALAALADSPTVRSSLSPRELELLRRLELPPAEWEERAAAAAPREGPPTPDENPPPPDAGDAALLKALAACVTGGNVAGSRCALAVWQEREHELFDRGGAVSGGAAAAAASAAGENGGRGPDCGPEAWACCASSARAALEALGSGTSERDFYPLANPSLEKAAALAAALAARTARGTLVRVKEGVRGVGGAAGYSPALRLAVAESARLTLALLRTPSSFSRAMSPEDAEAVVLLQRGRRVEGEEEEDEEAAGPSCARTRQEYLSEHRSVRALLFGAASLSMAAAACLADETRLAARPAAAGGQSGAGAGAGAGADDERRLHADVRALAQIHMAASLMCSVPASRAQDALASASAPEDDAVIRAAAEATAQSMRLAFALRHRDVPPAAALEPPVSAFPPRAAGATACRALFATVATAACADAADADADADAAAFALRFLCRLIMSTAFFSLSEADRYGKDHSYAARDDAALAARHAASYYQRRPSALARLPLSDREFAALALASAADRMIKKSGMQEHLETAALALGLPPDDRQALGAAVRSSKDETALWCNFDRRLTNLSEVAAAAAAAAAAAPPGGGGAAPDTPLPSRALLFWPAAVLAGDEGAPLNMWHALHEAAKEVRPNTLAREAPYIMAMLLAHYEHALDFARLSTTLAASPGVGPARRKAANAARANAEAASASFQYILLGEADRGDALVCVTYVLGYSVGTGPVDPRLGRAIARLAFAAVAPAAGLLERAIARGYGRAVAGGRAGSGGDEGGGGLEARARPLIEAVAAMRGEAQGGGAAGAAITPRLFARCVDAVGGPMEALALAHYGRHGDTASERPKLNPRYCGHIECPSLRLGGRGGGEAGAGQRGGGGGGSSSTAAAPRLKRCALCKVTAFCCESCQRAAHPTHRLICSLLRAAKEGRI